MDPESRDVIFHITARADWDAAVDAGEYRAESLTSEGFIHCSLRRQVLLVANYIYQGRTGLVLLEIDPEAVSAEIRYEGETDLFPHIYGPLNPDAVMRVIQFPPQSDGQFAFPSELA